MDTGGERHGARDGKVSEKRRAPRCTRQAVDRRRPRFPGSSTHVGRAIRSTPPGGPVYTSRIESDRSSSTGYSLTGPRPSKPSTAAVACGRHLDPGAPNGPVAKALDLKSIWLFSGCTASELRKIRSSLDEVEVPKGKVLVEEGRIGLEFFLIVNGTATVTRNGRKVADLGPGDHFGELALLDRRPRSASVVSETDMDLLVLSQRQFNSLLESVPTISRKMLAAMANRLREPTPRPTTDALRLSPYD